MQIEILRARDAKVHVVAEVRPWSKSVKRPPHPRIVHSSEETPICGSGRRTIGLFHLRRKLQASNLKRVEVFELGMVVLTHTDPDSGPGSCRIEQASATQQEQRTDM